jgi:hypothetical protein
VPPEVIDDINSFRYQERFQLSTAQMDAEPLEAIERALAIWAIDAEAEKTKSSSDF